MANEPKPLLNQVAHGLANITIILAITGLFVLAVSVTGVVPESIIWRVIQASITILLATVPVAFIAAIANHFAREPLNGRILTGFVIAVITLIAAFNVGGTT